MKKPALLFIFLFTTLLAVGQGMELDSNQKVKFAAIPFPIYNESIGFGLGLIGSVYYHLDRADTLSPASATGGFGFLSTNKTWVGLIYQQLYWGQNRNRATFAAGTGDINFQAYFDQIPGGYVSYSSDFSLLYADYMRNFVSHWFIGPAVILSKMSTNFPDYPVELPLEEMRTYNGLGIHTQWDSRDNIFYPYRGVNAEYRWLYYDPAYGSETQYSNNAFSTSVYQKISTSSIIAFNGQINVASGDSVPFEQQNIVGGRVLRGYTDGKYRANQVYSLQTEYRWTFWKNFGAVFFAGAAWAADNVRDLSFTETLPAGGVGLRWMMVPSERINIGVDYAWGKQDGGFYFRITEAF